MMDPVTITVERRAIDAVLRYADAHLTATQTEAGSLARQHCREVLEAVPVPRWLPTEDQITKFARVFQFSLPRQRDVVAFQLRRLYEEGLIA